MPIYIQQHISMGGSRSNPWAGYIEVASFSVGITHLTTVGSSTGGAGAGRVSLGDLQIGGSPVSRPSHHHKIIVTMPADPWSHGLLSRGRELEVSIIFANAVPGGWPTPRPRHTLNLSRAVITDIQPYSLQRSGGGDATRYEKLTLTFSDYYFNGAPNVSLQLISSIAVPFTGVAG
jgi:hypothetical protein